MGDRVSISFFSGDRESVALFSHWSGMYLVGEAKRFAADLEKETGSLRLGPLRRHEPCTVMVDFIRHLTSEMPRVLGNYYLGEDEEDGDNSDRGHFRIELADKEGF